MRIHSNHTAARKIPRRQFHHSHHRALRS
jgi:hypothetical protein